jgi:hypothetical protein
MRIELVKPREVAVHRIKPIVFSVALGIGTMALISLIELLPYSRLRDMTSDALALPGGLFAGLIYPAGVHTSAGAPLWGWIALSANVVFYIIVWFAILLILRNRRDRG